MTAQHPLPGLFIHDPRAGHWYTCHVFEGHLRLFVGLPYIHRRFALTEHPYLPMVPQPHQQPLGCAKVPRDALQLLKQLWPLHTASRALQLAGYPPWPVILRRCGKHRGSWLGCRSGELFGWPRQLRPFLGIKLNGQVHRPLTDRSTNSHCRSSLKSLSPCYRNMKPEPRGWRPAKQSL